MRLRSIGVILKLCFALVFVIALGAVDFISRRAHAEGDYTLSMHVRSLPGRVGLGSAEPAEPLTLAQLMPAAPRGWTVRPFQRDDIALLIGEAADGKQGAGLGQLGAGDLAGPQQVEARTYVKGKTVALLRIGRVEAADLAAADPQAAQDVAAAATALAAGGTGFANVQGLVFTEQPVRSWGVARRLTASLPPQVEIELVTTAEPGEIVDLLAGLDVGALNATLEQPQPGLGRGGVRLLDGATAPAEAGTEGTGWSLSRLFGGGGKAEQAQAAPVVRPVATSCSTEKGFKRCTIN